MIGQHGSYRQMFSHVYVPQSSPPPLPSRAQTVSTTSPRGRGQGRGRGRDGGGGGGGGSKGQPHLVGHRLVLQARLVEQQFQLAAVEVGHAQRLHQTGVPAGLHRLVHKRHRAPLNQRQKNSPKQQTEKTREPYFVCCCKVK